MGRLRWATAAAMWELGRLWRRAVRSLGLAGVLAVGAALVAAGLALWGQELEREAESLRTRARNVAAGTVPPAVSAPDPEAEFRSRLVAHDDIAVVVKDLLSSATRHRLQVTQAEYRAESDEVGGFVRYRITLPVKGVGSDVQAFMDDALRAQAALAVDALQFRREAVVSRQVEARLQWVLFAAMPQSVALAASGGRRP